MKLLHIGLCVNKEGKYSSFPEAFKKVLGAENYREVATSDKDLHYKATGIFDSFKPDIVFMQIQCEGIVDIQLMDYFKSHGAYVINWTGDKRNDIPEWMIEAAPFVSCTAFSNMDDVIAMRKRGYHSEYLEIGYDETIYCPEGEKYVCQDIVFFGNNYGNTFPLGLQRIDMVNALKARYGKTLGVYGINWGALGSGNINSSQHDEAKYYRGAKIAINFSHYNSLKYTSDRMFRILGTGVMCLSHKYHGIEEVFEVGKELDVFEDINQLIKKIDFYLAHDEKRKEIAKAGNEKAKKCFTFINQVENIIKLAE